MKRLLVFFASALIALVSLLFTTSCNSRISKGEARRDSIKIANIVKSVIKAEETPRFEDVIYVMDYRSRLEATKMFLDLSDQTCANIASVLIKRSGSCTIAEIVTEYAQNRAIYDNLPPIPIPTPAPDSVTIDSTNEQVVHREQAPKECTTSNAK